MIRDQLNIETLQTTAVVENGFLRGTELLPQLDGETVQVVVIRIKTEKTVANSTETPVEYEQSDPTPQEWNRMLMQSSAFKAWADPAEDIYRLEDGEPIEWDKP